jgi:hypothetical protein
VASAAHSPDNRHMAAATRGRRLSSGVLSSTVSLPWHSPTAARILFATGWIAVGLVIGLAGGSWWWAAAAVLMLVGLLALRSNGECLLWTWDEIHSQARKASFAGRSRPLSSHDQRVRLRDVGPGDWICDYDDHRLKLDEAEREYQRRRADQIADQQLRKHFRPTTTRPTIGPAARHSSLDGPAPLDLTRSPGILSPDIPEILPAIQRNEPAKDWMQVLFIVPTSDGKDAELGLLHRKNLTAPLERWYYHRPGADGPESEDPALAELMSLLRSSDGACRESEIAGKLRGSGHSVVFIRRAIAAAITIGLARRVRHRSWGTEVLTGAFGVGEPPGTGHRSCFLELTGAGRAWLEAGDPKPEPRRPRWRLKQRCQHCGAPVKAAKMFEDDPQCDRCQEFPGGNYISADEEKD